MPNPKLEIFKQQVPRHTHSGVDSPRVQYPDIADRKIYVHYTVTNEEATNASAYGVFFIAPETCYVSGVKESHGTASSGAATFQVVRMADGVDIHTGTAVLNDVISGTAAANTVQTGVATTVIENIQLKKNDRLGIKPIGDLAAIEDVAFITEITFN